MTVTTDPLRRLVLRLHFYAGLLVGPFLLVAAVTGGLYALAPSIEEVVYSDQLTAASTAQTVPLDRQIATAQARHAELPLAGIIPGTDGATTRVLFSDPTLPSSSYSRVVFVDPSDGSVHGDTVQYGSAQALPLRTWLSEMHRRLHLGEPGRLYSELAASWLAPVALAGLYLWWDRVRRTRRPLLRTRRGLTGRARHRSRHAVLGTWALAGMLVLSVTGLTWSTYAGAHVSELREALHWTTPTLSAKAPGAAAGAAAPTAGGHEGHEGHAGHAGHAGHTDGPATPGLAGLDTALSSAHAAGLTDPVQLTPPAAAGAPWRVKETRRSYEAGPDAVAVDGATGQVVQALPFRDYPLAAKLTDWGIRLHMGVLFGLANQLLLAALAAAIAVVTVRGYLLWWGRRPTRTGGLPQPPVRGAALELLRRRPIATVLGALVVVAVGWAVPLLGLSLAAFLTLDVVLALYHRTTTRTAASATA